MKDKKIYICNDCNKKVDKVVECEYCNKKFCLDCITTTYNLYDIHHCKICKIKYT